jgi:small GTP-binding protein
MVTTKKIVFIGMDNAGKTTIINSFSQQMKDYRAITPTSRVERTEMHLLGKEIMVWDFGGQDKYRELYITNPEKYFDEISFLFFVVDVQDESRLQLSIDYFQKIIEGLLALSPDAKIILLFHKNDPDKQDLIEKLNIQIKFLEAVEPYIDTYRSNIKSGDGIKRYNTSVFYLTSIIRAVTEPLLEKSVLPNTLSDMLMEFIQQCHLKAAILYTTNQFELGMASSDDIKPGDRDAVLMYYLNHIIPTPEIRIDMGFTNGINYKLLMTPFVISQGNQEITFFLVIIYDKMNGFFQKEDAIARFIENYQKLTTSMKLFEVDTRFEEKNILKKVQDQNRY